MTLPIKLYQMQGCPYCRKVSELLDRKGLEYENVWVYEGENDEAERAMLTELTGQRLVPVIDYDGTIINDSSRIVDFIEDKH